MRHRHWQKPPGTATPSAYRHRASRRLYPPPANNPICPSGCTPPVRGKALRDAWNLDSADRAARVLARLAGSLERDHPGAAASIREGLDETLTVQRLGLTGALQRTLRTTNIIENLSGSVERYTRNVKRWRGGQMIQRWVASALVEAEKHFRRVRGYRDLQRLVGALDALAPPDGVIADVA